MTFGFYSAVNIATEAIDCIHTTASSHNRVFIVEVMGHKVGWLTLYAGIASGADVILIPEIPYDIDKVVGAIERRKRNGSGFTILAVAEGAISKEDAQLGKKELKKKIEERILVLTDDEIDSLVYEKWFGTIVDLMTDLVVQPLKEELNILEMLINRYSQTLSAIELECETLEK